jgi:hypothetical protein
MKKNVNININININTNKSTNKSKNNKNSDVNIKIFNRKNKRNYNIQIKNRSSNEMNDTKKSKPKDLNKNIQNNKIITKRNLNKIKDEQKEIYHNRSEAFLFEKIIKDNRNGVKTPKSILQRYKRNVPLIRPDRIKYNKSYLNKTSITEEKYINKNKYKNYNFSNNYINNYINCNQIIFKRKENSGNYKIASRLNNKNKIKNNILIISQDSIEEEEINERSPNQKNLSSINFSAKNLLDESIYKIINIKKKKKGDEFPSSSKNYKRVKTSVNSPSRGNVFQQKKSPITKRNN